MNILFISLKTDDDKQRAKISSNFSHLSPVTKNLQTYKLKINQNFLWLFHLDKKISVATHLLLV